MSGSGIIQGYGPIVEVQNERKRQDARWGEQNHEASYWLGIIAEEMGEVAKAMIECEPHEYRAELVHLAACCVAAMESFDRNGK
jgi:hypothetical protein